jgi:hypothetical protein
VVAEANKRYAPIKDNKSLINPYVKEVVDKIAAANQQHIISAIESVNKLNFNKRKFVSLQNTKNSNNYDSSKHKHLKESQISLQK